MEPTDVTTTTEITNAMESSLNASTERAAAGAAGASDDAAESKRKLDEALVRGPTEHEARYFDRSLRTLRSAFQHRNQPEELCRRLLRSSRYRRFQGNVDAEDASQVVHGARDVNPILELFDAQNVKV